MNLTNWKYFFRLYKGEYRTLIFTIFLSIGQSLLVLPIAFLVRRAFDEVIPSGNLEFLLLIGGGILLLNLSNQGLTLWSRHLTLKTNKRAVNRLRQDLLTMCYSFPRSFYSESDRSRLHAVCVQDTERLDWMSNALVALFLPSLVVCIGLSGVLIYLNWSLFLLMAALTPFLFLASRMMKNHIQEKTKAFHRAFESFSKGTSFVLKMLDLTKIQTAEGFEKERQKRNILRVEATSRIMAWLNAAYTSVQNGIVTISGVLILVVGGIAVSRGSMTLGSLLSFYVGVSLMNRYLRTLLSSIPHIIEGKESLDTLYRTMNSYQKSKYTGVEKISFKGEIVLDSVHFRYGDELTLQNINLSVPQNSTVVLAGPSGAGKTTIVYLILGFYKPERGEIYADGRPYSQLDIKDLRQSIGVVTQDPMIFSGTLWANITYGSPDVPEEEVICASELAAAHEFIKKLPRGYETLTGEEGVLLSGGQRQRIALARALLRKPKLLILDEPFNNLDAATAERLMENFKKMDESPSILMVSHDSKIIGEVHGIYRIDEGVIVENRKGNGKDLKEKKITEGAATLK